jgi:hypothetical protein
MAGIADVETTPYPLIVLVLLTVAELAAAARDQLPPRD